MSTRDWYEIARRAARAALAGFETEMRRDPYLEDVAYDAAAGVVRETSRDANRVDTDKLFSDCERAATRAIRERGRR